MRDPTGPKIDDLIGTEFERGLKGEDAVQFQKVEWVDYFHYKEDIFDPDMPLPPDEYYDRVAELQFVAKLAGNQKARGFFYHLALVGPRGFGKQTLLTTIHKSLKRLEKASGFVIDIVDNRNLDTGEDYPDKLHVSREFQEADYIFFVNCRYSVHLAQWLEVASTAKKLVITSWRPFHYFLGRQHFNQQNRSLLPSKEIFLHEMKREDLVKLIQKRLVSRGSEKNPIALDEISLAAKHSLGNIRTFLYFLKHAHKIAMLANHHAVSDEDVLRAINEVGSTIESLTLSDKEVKLLLYILDQRNIGEEITPTKTAQYFDWDLPLTWRYFKRLVTKKILIKEGTQKTTKYGLNEIYLSLGENFFMKNYLMSDRQVNSGE